MNDHETQELMAQLDSMLFVQPSKPHTTERTTLIVAEGKTIPARLVLFNPHDSDSVAALFSKEDLDALIFALECAEGGTSSRILKLNELHAGLCQLRAAAFPEPK